MATDEGYGGNGQSERIAHSAILPVPTRDAKIYI